MFQNAWGRDPKSGPSPSSPIVGFPSSIESGESIESSSTGCVIFGRRAKE